MILSTSQCSTLRYVLLASAIVWRFRTSAKADDGPPVITQQPQSLELIASEDGSFSVVASGTEPLVYQWRLNGDDIPGATTASYGINNVQRGNAGGYSVVITNAANAVTSAIATLTVVYPRVVVDPAAAWVSIAEGGVGGVAQFSVAPLPRPPLAYQWRFNGSDLRWQTSSNLILNVDSTAKAGDYSVWITTSAGGVESPPVRLEVPSVKAAREQWVTNVSCSAPKMVTDKEGCIYTLGNSSGSGFSLLKCDRSGHILWTSTFETPPSNSDQANDIAVDDNGNVYTTGYTPLIAGGAGYLTVKFDHNGAVLWSRTYEMTGATSAANSANGVTVDGAGNVYVTGGCSQLIWTPFGRDFVTIKYGPDGNQLWLKRYDSGSLDDGYGVALDSATNVIVTGSFITIKYDRDGNEIWRQGGSGRKVVIDTSDDVFVADQDRDLGGPVFPRTVHIVKLSGTNGQILPITGGQPAPFLWLVDLLVDHQGDVFAVGWTWPNIYDHGLVDIVVMKFGVGGSNNWTDTFRGNPVAAAVDEQGNLYVIGSRTAYDSQCRIVKWNNQGQRAWVLDPPRNSGSSLCVDANFNLIVAAGGITSYDQSLRVHSLGFLSNGAFRLTVTGEPAVPQWLQASTNLSNWQPLSLLHFSAGTADYTDTSAPDFPLHFFRTVRE
jgi:hypothetical protein